MRGHVAEIRKDSINGSWVISAPERAQRPQQSTLDNQQSLCPFCCGNEAETPPAVFTLRDPNPIHPEWCVRVVPNRYPALSPHSDEQTRSDSASAPAIGAHEVIIESPEHIEDMAVLDEAQFVRILAAYRQRLAALGGDERWRCVLLFKNQGIAAGGSLLHVHSQLIAMPIVPPALERELAGARAYHAATGSCGYCATIARELSASVRIVSVNENYLAFCPYISRVAYETWIFPRRHHARFEASKPEHDIDLARALRGVLSRIGYVLDSRLFNYIIHTGSSHESDSSYYHWHIEVLPRLVQIGGFEWGTGCYINSKTPEECARSLRQVAL